jgi:hypothetical protein
MLRIWIFFHNNINLYFSHIFQTGYIRTATGNYFIEPSETINDHVTPTLHTIYRARPLADGNELPEQIEKPYQHEQNCGVQGMYMT